MFTGCIMTDLAILSYDQLRRALLVVKTQSKSFVIVE